MKTAILLAIMAVIANPASPLHAAPAEAGRALDAALQRQADAIDRETQRKLDAALEAALESAAPLAAPEVQSDSFSRPGHVTRHKEPLRLADNHAR